MKRMFSNDPDAETCEEIEVFIDLLHSSFASNNLHRFELWEWEKSKDGSVFWCSMDGEAFESSEGVCGSECASYAPRNGKSGRCRFHGPCWKPTEKRFILTRKGLNDEKRRYGTTMLFCMEDK